MTIHEMATNTTGVSNSEKREFACDLKPADSGVIFSSKFINGHVVP